MQSKPMFRFSLILGFALALTACSPASEPKAAQAPKSLSPEAATAQSVPEDSPMTPVIRHEPNRIRWATASERDNFGFDVYRGLAETGPFEIINDQVIQAAGTTDIPQRYEFVDDTNEPDTTYWYYIESISMDGERKIISPVYSSDPKPALNQ